MSNIVLNIKKLNKSGSLQWQDQLEFVLLDFLNLHLHHELAKLECPNIVTLQTIVLF